VNLACTFSLCIWAVYSAFIIDQIKSEESKIKMNTKQVPSRSVNYLLIQLETFPQLFPLPDLARMHNRRIAQNGRHNIGKIEVHR
jgi:hypothetical protein